MSLRGYANYKDSGIEWLGKVPEQWKVVRFSRLMAGLNDGTHGSFPRVAEGRPLLSAKNVQNGRLHVSDDESLIQDSDYASIVANGFPRRGDLLLTIVGTIGRSCVYEFDDPHAFQRSVCFVRLQRGNHPKFFYYFTQSQFFQEQLASRSKSAAQGGIYLGDVAATTVVCPSLVEQEEVALFLDRETARIDALVAEQDRLVNLLEEKRRAVISHAVTSGLNPDVPMKPSGIYWLGNVPAHWSVLPLKRVASVQTGIAKGKDYSDRATVNVSYLRVANVQDGFLDLDEVTQLSLPPEDVGRYLLRSGDVLMNEGGDFDKLGRGCVWNGQVSPCIHQNHVFAVRPHALSSAWLSTVLGSAYAQFYFMTQAKQTTNLASISSTNLMNLPVVLPPEEEQQEIVESIRQRTQQIDALADAADEASRLLRERRVTLISAAVTGLIDIRVTAAVEQPA